MDKNTPQGKGFRTGIQTIAGVVLAYFTGLMALPEVREYTYWFIQTSGLEALITVLVAFGVGSGVISFIQNKLGK